MGRPILTAAGGIEDYIGTSMDITERKRGEDALRVAQAEITRVARLTMMGELAASIAHEINQPLGAIVASSNACSRWLAKTPLPIDNVRRAMERIAAEGHRAGDIVRSVRALTRKSGAELVALDINDAIRDVLLWSAANSTITVSRSKPNCPMFSIPSWVTGSSCSRSF